MPFDQMFTGQNWSPARPAAPAAPASTCNTPKPDHSWCAKQLDFVQAPDWTFSHIPYQAFTVVPVTTFSTSRHSPSFLPAAQVPRPSRLSDNHRTSLIHPLVLFPLIRPRTKNLGQHMVVARQPRPCCCRSSASASPSSPSPSPTFSSWASWSGSASAAAINGRA